jgi:hypothetical protein
LYDATFEERIASSWQRRHDKSSTVPGVVLTIQGGVKMQSRKWLMAGILVLIVAMLAGCGDRGSGKMRTGQQDLEKFANKLTSLNVYEQLGLVHMASGAGEDTVYLQVRK